ncbi:hypothetical protein OY671_012896, partial [Metschnikowia pulcherrima]
DLPAHRRRRPARRHHVGSVLRRGRGRDVHGPRARARGRGRPGTRAGRRGRAHRHRALEHRCPPRLPGAAGPRGGGHRVRGRRHLRRRAGPAGHDVGQRARRRRAAARRADRLGLPARIRGRAAP